MQAKGSGPGPSQPTDGLRDGKTMRFLGIGDPDHLETFSAYFVRPGQVLRALTRQLFSYPPSGSLSNPARAFQPVPDVAVDLPSLASGGISSDGRIYTIGLRDGILWDTSPPREVSAADFVRGMKRLADPKIGAGALDYFSSTIAGMQGYYDEFAKNFQGQRPTAAELARFQSLHEIDGLQAINEKTLSIRLKQPANDFLHLLAMGLASPAPREYDDNPPGRECFWRNIISNGPYRVAPGPANGHEIALEPNPLWSQQSDPIRQQDLQAIYLQAAPISPQKMQHQIDLGRADPAWSFTLTSWGKPTPDDLPFPLSYPGFSLNPYLVFNLHSPNAGGATGKLEVRQAIAYAVDRIAVKKIFDALTGVAVEPLHSVIPPGSHGHRKLDLYPTLQGRPDAERARRLLAKAGYRKGLTLIAAVRNVKLHQDVMHLVAKDLKKIGITLQMQTYGEADFYGSLLSDPVKARAGAWDIAEAGWTPDWWGNNGRTIIQPLFLTDFNPGTTNYGGFSNAEVDRLIEQALQTADPERAQEIWHQADKRIMQDLPVLPLLAFACKCCAARSATGLGTWQGFSSGAPAVEAGHSE